MKLKLLFAICLLSLPALAGKTGRLTVNWTFINVIEGYDHNNKIVVYVDNKMLGESPEFIQSSKASFSVDVPLGKHTVKIENYAYYEGKWDLHRTSNGYSVDAYYEKELTLSKSTTIDMLCDVDTESCTFKVTGAKEGKVLGSPMTITWIYKNVEEGYDHQNRMQVYCDGQLIAISEIFQESKKGKLKVVIPHGSHNVTIENYAYYQGNWELHSVANDYSLDVMYSEDKMYVDNKKRSVDLVIDMKTLDMQTTVK